MLYLKIKLNFVYIAFKLLYNNNFIEQFDYNIFYSKQLFSDSYFARIFFPTGTTKNIFSLDQMINALNNLNAHANKKIRAYNINSLNWTQIQLNLCIQIFFTHPGTQKLSLIVYLFFISAVRVQQLLMRWGPQFKICDNPSE